MTLHDTDLVLQREVLMAALADAPFDGFTPGLLASACAANKVGPIVQARLFPNGILSLVEAFSRWADEEMLARLDPCALSTMKIRARIELCVRTRLEVLRPYKEAARRAGAFLSLPMHALLAAKLVWRSVDAMWRAAGDRSSDFNFYTKRAILAGVYSATLVRWFNDDSEDEAATKVFLAHRISDVLRFEAFKADLGKRLRGAQGPLSARDRRRGTRL